MVYPGNDKKNKRIQLPKSIFLREICKRTPGDITHSLSEHKRGVTELLRRHSCLFPEESAEIRGIREVEVVGYFLHGLLRILEQRNPFANYGLEHQLLSRISTDGIGQN